MNQNTDKDTTPIHHNRFEQGFGGISTPKINTANPRANVAFSQHSADPCFLLENEDFSDIVAFHVKCDSILQAGSKTPLIVSQKKCRFCC